jgi:hypothetical protein
MLLVFIMVFQKIDSRIERAGLNFEAYICNGDSCQLKQINKKLQMAKLLKSWENLASLQV